LSKILYIHHYWGIGGAGITLLNYSKIIGKKHDLLIYCPENPSDMFYFLTEHGFKVKKYSKNPGSISYYSGSRFGKSFFIGLLNIFKNKKYWEDIIKEEDPEIVIVNSIVLSPMGKIIKKYNKKSICVVQETFKDRKISMFNRKLKHLLNEYFDGVLFISKYDLNKAKLNKPIQKVINNFIELDTSNKEANFPPNIPKNRNGKFNILFVGGYNKLKGTHIIIKALNLLKDKYNVKLNIYGYKKKSLSKIKRYLFFLNDFYVHKIDRFIKKHKLESYIEYHGVTKDLSKAFEENDVLVFPSTKPHQSRPSFEVGLYKKPVIISDFDQTKEFVIDGYNGLCFEPNDYVDLSKKIEQLILDTNLLKQLGENNYSQTMKYHTNYAMENLLLEFIEEVLEK